MSRVPAPLGRDRLGLWHRARGPGTGPLRPSRSQPLALTATVVNTRVDSAGQRAPTDPVRPRRTSQTPCPRSPSPATGPAPDHLASRPRVPRQGVNLPGISCTRRGGPRVGPRGARAQRRTGHRRGGKERVTREPRVEAQDTPGHRRVRAGLDPRASRAYRRHPGAWPGPWPRLRDRDRRLDVPLRCTR